MCELDKIAEQLKKDGFTGLYYPGECACAIDDLAPCGECEKAGEYINDCEGGYKFTDPNDPNFWIVRSKNEAPTDDEWKKWRDEYA